MAKTRYKRVPPDSSCIITGDLLNRIMTDLEKFGGLRVAPPLMLDDHASGFLIKLATVGGGGTLIPLTLTKTSGSDGDATHQPSYVYTAVNRITGAAFGTGLTPEWGRTSGSFTIGTMGFGYMNGSTAVLMQVNELPILDASCV